MCLGSHALRKKNIQCISRFFAESKHCIWRVVGLALFKNEEYTLHSALLGWHTLCSLQMAYRSTVYFSTGTIGTIGTNRRVVSARLSSGNICSLQMEHRSAAFFSIGTIGSNGTNRQMVYAWPSGVNICRLQIVYQSTYYFFNGIDSNQWHQSTNRLRTALK